MMIQQKPNLTGLSLLLNITIMANMFEGILMIGDDNEVAICDFGTYTVIVYADGVKRTINNSFFNSKDHCREVLEGILENN